MKTAFASLVLLALGGPCFAQQNPVTASSPDGKLVARATDKAISVFDAATQKELIRIQGHTGNVTALAYSPDGRMLVSGGEDKAVRIWDAPTGKELRRLTAPDGVVSVAFSQDGKTLTVKSKDQKTQVWDVATGKQIQ